MNALTLLLDQPWAQALAWTLIHFVWQGAAIGLAAAALLRVSRLTSAGRYAVGVAALAAMLIAPAATFAALSMSAEAAPVGLASTPVSTTTMAEVADVAPREAAMESAMVLAVPDEGVAPMVPAVLAVWLVGVLALSIRLLGGWVVARRLATHAVRPVSPEVHALARRVAGRLALDRIVRFFESTAVAVPVTVGWLKPVVLLPASALSGLTTTQIEALLAHELAHVRRHDYLVNLLQSAVETLLFYHPAVWWVSKLIRAERENCCDDVAVGVCDRLVYVGALSDLAAMTVAPRLALAATDGSLLGRVRRLLGHQEHDGESGSSWVPALLVLLLAVAMVPVVAQSAGASRGEAQTGGVVVKAVPVVVKEIPRGVVSGVAGRVVVSAAQTDVRVVPVNDAMPVVVPVVVGVAAGVRAPVDATAVVGITQSSATQRQRERMRELEREMAALAAQLRNQEADIEQERAKLEMQQLQASVQARSADLQAQLKLARQRSEDSRRRVETGVGSQTELAAAESAVVRFEQQLAQALQQRQFQEAQLVLRLREVDQRRDYQDRMSDVEMSLRDIEVARGSAMTEARVAAIDAELAATRDRLADRLQTLGADHPDVAALRAQMQGLEVVAEQQLAEVQRVRQVDVARAQQLVAEVQARGAEAEQRNANVERARRAALEELYAARAMRAEARPELDRVREVMARTVVVTDASAEVRENDLLVIEISGESELPRNYEVGTDGNIRLPLLGEMQVRGMTASQVRQLVADRLADRQLAEGASITVQLRRPGGGRVR